MKNKILIVLLFSALISKAQTVISLYPDKVPGSENWNWQEKIALTDSANEFHTVYNVTKPTLTVYSPDKALNNGTAVIICPSGAFTHLAIDKEGTMVAKWLNYKGITAFVFKHRLLKSEFDASDKPIQIPHDNRKKFDSLIAPIISFAVTDAINAIKYVREHSSEYDIKKNKIGIMGFSAGGTVAAGTVFSPDGIGNRPDFIAPIYAYTGPFKDLSVPADAPPAFISAAIDDLVIPG